MTSDFDRSLAGHNSFPVHVECVECGHEWDDLQVEEYGMGWLEDHEECEKCGASGETLRTDLLSDADLAERRAEARGEDF